MFGVTGVTIRLTLVLVAALALAAPQSGARAQQLPDTPDVRAVQALVEAVAALPPTGHVTVSAAAVGACVEIRVVDDGPGVPPEHLPHLFDRYYRVSDREARSGGTGLGLAIVKRLVELHGGTVAAATRPEGGMVFSLILPSFGTS